MTLPGVNLPGDERAAWQSAAGDFPPAKPVRTNIRIMAPPPRSKSRRFAFDQQERCPGNRGDNIRRRHPIIFRHGPMDQFELARTKQGILVSQGRGVFPHTQAVEFGQVAGLAHTQLDKKFIGGEPVFCRNRAVRWPGEKIASLASSSTLTRSLICPNIHVSNALLDFPADCNFLVHNGKSTLLPEESRSVRLQTVKTALRGIHRQADIKHRSRILNGVGHRQPCRGRRQVRGHHEVHPRPA
jgi:hypothetical protein